MKIHFSAWLFLTALATAVNSPAQSSVKIWQEPMVIPTYEVAPPDPNPRFYSGRTYQGAKATFYPYPVYDRLTDVRTNKTYKAVWLENQYVKICVLPELGGRIFSAVDKANNYDFFYHQHVIKPALIGMLGAWISGGVEWNVPHHHRATSFMPVDYTLQTNPDGSKTVWLGEIELRHRMKWLVGLTLYPGRSYLEMNMKMFNRTPFAQSMLFWINPAVHANENYQVIFPPDAEWAVQHAKPEFASWPIARQRYGGTDYTRGVDISWWKNNPSPVSFFCFHSDQDFFGGYDHGKKAGVLHVADHNVAPGKKFFEWGNGPEGEMWSKVLTDEDGPYLELMAGAWSDNQPDYSWIQPGETREWKHYWFPIRNLGGVKAANANAAINLEITNRIAKIAVNATKAYPKASVEISWVGHVFWQCETNLSPLKYFAVEVPMDFGFDPAKINEFEVVVRQNKTNVLVSYKPQLPKNSPMPKPVERPKSPADYKTSDELYFTGQRIEQLHSPSFEAAPYYEEMLKRDAGDYRANTALGILLCKQWRWEEAEKHLRQALERATANYIRPKDGEAFYYLGVALRRQNKAAEMIQLNGPSLESDPFEAAADAFHKATWSSAWQAAAYYELAEIECQRRDFARALDNINRSLAANSRNPKALDLRSAILRHQGQLKEALQMAAYAAAIDPLDLGSRVEQYFAELQFPSKRRPDLDSERIKNPPALQDCSIPNRLELGVNYANGWFEAEANTVLLPPAFQRLSAFGESRYEYTSVNPLLLYQAAVDQHLQSDWAAFYKTVSKDGHEECFPFQFESIETLSRASQRDPLAGYYLGNLLYDNQPERAIKSWEIARERLAAIPAMENDPLPAVIHRNLGFAYAQHEKDPAKAIASYEKAIELNPKDPRYFYELDVQYEAAGAPLPKRLEMLTKHHEAVAIRDDALMREIVLLTVAGQADRALELLRSRRFHNWEGSRDIHNVYANACLRRGQQNFAAKKYRAALQDVEAALQYPDNLEVGKSRREQKTIEVNYFTGLAYEALGDAEKAKASFEKAVARKEGAASESQYCQALAMQKLGRQEEAAKIFEGLIKKGQADLETAPTVDYFAKFGEKQSDRARKAQAHYLVGLGYLGQGKQAEAQAAFQKALEQNPAHLGANIQMGDKR